MCRAVSSQSTAAHISIYKHGILVAGQVIQGLKSTAGDWMAATLTRGLHACLNQQFVYDPKATAICLTYV